MFDLLHRADIAPDSKLRIAILYALRYQKHPSAQIRSVVTTLLQQGVSESKAGLVFVMLNLAGAEQRQDDLFSNEGFFSRGRNALQRGLKGVENVYTQHTPHLASTIESLMRGRLKETSYPYVGGNSMPEWYRPQDVILFVIGGATFEEGRYVHLLNQQGLGAGQGGHGGPGTQGGFAANSGPGSQGGSSTPNLSGGGAGGGAGGANPSTPRFLLGGTTMLNSSSWLDMIQDAASRFGPTAAKPPPNLGSAAGGGGAAGQAGGGGMNLRIGPVQLSTGGGGGDSGRSSQSQSQQFTGPGGIADPARLGDAAQGAAEFAGGLWGKLRDGVGR